MSLQFQKILEDMSEQLGYTQLNRLGSGHLEAIHPNGARVRLPFTPRNEWREKRNARAALERGAGRKLPRDNSGKTRGQGKVEGWTNSYQGAKSKKAQARERFVERVKEIDAEIRKVIEVNTRKNYEQAKRLFEKRREVVVEASEQGIRIDQFMI